jgi:hypothetical protein
MNLFTDLVCMSDTISACEETRLNTVSLHRCPDCNELLTTGEYESAGICCVCYFDLMETQAQ